MSNWILYDEFVDLVLNHHHSGFSGLITGVSDNQHSFQVGFINGKIVLLSYRIKKGQAALELISQIERAKVSEHPQMKVQDNAHDVPETSSILSRLTANTLDSTATRTDFSDVAEPREQKNRKRRVIEPEWKKVIETAAVHHFGPIGAMVCEEYLQDPIDDIRTVILAIAQDVGASEADTRAFFKSVSIQG